MKHCHYCGPTDRELRPYGPNGANVCFPCAMATPEREKETENQFVSQIVAAGPEVEIGTEAGPVALNRSTYN